MRRIVVRVTQHDHHGGREPRTGIVHGRPIEPERPALRLVRHHVGTRVRRHRRDHPRPAAQHHETMNELRPRGVAEQPVPGGIEFLLASQRVEHRLEGRVRPRRAWPELTGVVEHRAEVVVLGAGEVLSAELRHHHDDARPQGELTPPEQIAVRIAAHAVHHEEHRRIGRRTRWPDVPQPDVGASPARDHQARGPGHLDALEPGRPEGGQDRERESAQPTEQTHTHRRQTNARHCDGPSIDPSLM